jgi:hypothetical protein
VVVRGLGRYMELRAVVEEKKREKEEALKILERGGVKNPLGFGAHRGTTQVKRDTLIQIYIHIIRK